MAPGQDPSPAPERSLDHQTVLEEDEYTAAISHIIARDFFPSLVHLDATNDYLDALSTRDPQLISASVRRLEQVSTPAPTSRGQIRTPSRTPYSLDTVDTPRAPDGQAPTKRRKFDIHLSLDTFQARYTSEDNSSFAHILESENHTRREKWGWAWDAQKRVEAQRDKLVAARERRLLEAPPAAGIKEKLLIEAPTPAGLVTDGSEMKATDEEKQSDDTARQRSENAFADAGANEQRDIMSPAKDARVAGVDGWKFKARNSLMFPPDADESPHKSVVSTETDPDPKTIKYGNTRLGESDPSPSIAPPSPTRSRIEAAITGTPYRPKLPPSSFGLIPNIPSPTAAELGPDAIKQLMTWGTLNATPRIISQSDDRAEERASTASFHLPQISHREIISQKLSNKASKSLRAKAGLLGLTPGILHSTPTNKKRKGDMAPPLWTPRRSDAAGNLTPAARRLLDRTTMGTAAARRAEVMERSIHWENGGKEKDLNQVRWTPTPKTLSR